MLRTSWIAAAGIKQDLDQASPVFIFQIDCFMRDIMNYLLSTILLLMWIAQGFTEAVFGDSEPPRPAHQTAAALQPFSQAGIAPDLLAAEAYGVSRPTNHTSAETRQEPYPFQNPAGCSPAAPRQSSPEDLLINVQDQLGSEFNLKERQIYYVWNGPLGSYIDITGNPFAFEFEINLFQPPFTYKADQLVTIFVQNGFAVWLRSYGGNFRLLAVPLVPGVEESAWRDYAAFYWENGGMPEDEFIVPVSKKLPCHWMIDAGYASSDAVKEMFNFDWRQPDFLASGRQYLADTCSEAYQVSQQLGFWDATSMCGPLTWQIVNDANGFPYRIGNYDANADLFIKANPRYWGHRPWTGFDPETFDLVVQTKEQLAGFDFQTRGDLYPGDILFSYGSANQWAEGGGYFSHIFMVAAIGEGESRLAVTNLVMNRQGASDCFIREEVLYTPGDRDSGMINYGWNDHGYGITGRYGFDVFRWKWITYHIEGKSRQYTVRWGDTIETIAFDWKVSPQRILDANQLSQEDPLQPGQVVLLPVPAE